MSENQKTIIPATKKGTVFMEAVDTKGDHEWVHEGRVMKPGDKAEVSLDQALRLEKAGAARPA